MKTLFEKVCIIGVGLIGGSLGMALISRGLAQKVTGVDTDPDNLKLALELEAINEGSTDPVTASAEADLVVIATPVGTTAEIIRQIAPGLKKGCIVTDVGSTKSLIVREAQNLLPPGVFFIGGHPMTGAETAGVRGADRYLFENAVYILTPVENTDEKALEKIEKLIEGIGGKTTVLPPEEHDLMVAAVSHLPHLVATALVNTVGKIEKQHEGVMMLAAGGFRDTTRVASGQPLMWRDICMTNKDHILEVLDKFSEVLKQMRMMIKACDDRGLEQAFTEARELRNNIPSKVKGYLPSAFEIVATVPDRPGSISTLTGYLGAEGINISDIEILRVREGEGGTIRLALSSEEDQEKALKVLKEKGINVKKR